MRIIFIGSVIFSAKALEKLLSVNANIVGIVTKEESAFNSDFFDLATIAKKHGIPYNYVNNINSAESIEWMGALQPDVIFCFGWSNLIKKQVLEMSRLGVIGFHPSLLPDNKGRHPLIWAKVLGLPKTGSTFFFMDEGADTGDILSQREFVIDFNDDAGSLYDKMTATALEQIVDFHETLKNNTYKRTKQDPLAGNNWRKRGMKDGLIDFRMTTETICNLVRGLTRPYAGAHADYKTEAIKVWKAEPGNFTNDNIEPGKVLQTQEASIEVKTGNGSIWLIEHEFTELPEAGTYII
ncbi:methionyl-tRNA formyltransferase [Flavobacterium cyanobacteriorum]|uniref:Methionyl-tRNA formyltransferase n=1 Tax=Flavobacterium cyanobacteriorum TaxID=2022802 RepID=A0A255YTW8_9FLAO|nr:formyltransferase family protein [Flavobacterium cyanobacteriorum]OYQ32104.1 methionyl-tRNA formyltransferase [Flavobacterium cyanobacteriorum]